MAHAPALFSPRLFATGEAKRWALAMVTASGPLLRARVSLLAVHRRAGGAAYADRYATEVDRHLETYSDWQTNARGFWCEWAFSLIDLQRPQEAIEKALLALADHRGIPIYQDGIGYALSAGLSASVRLREQGVRAGGSAHEALTFLESRLSQPKSVVSGGTNHHIARLREAGRLLLGDRIGRLTYRELVRLLDQH